MKCEKCNGTGEIHLRSEGVWPSDEDIRVQLYRTCPDCNSTGEIDWIDYIIPTRYNTEIKTRLINKYDAKNIYNFFWII